jgi:SpoVK/Ycf46/Vps4 family AAA+-type ATPase
MTCRSCCSEFLRKGRWDELFFVDLPKQEERQEIWRIQIARHKRDQQVERRLRRLAA